MTDQSYEPVIGLEVHVELKTKSKMFCGCPADWFGKEPNTLTCPVCLGLPGALPVPNRKAVEWTILLGLALKCQINRESKFDRKHYFYPDLPKGYQITQYDEPLAESGKLKVESGKWIRIRRIHLEEDTGKLIHSSQIPGYDGPPDVSLVDFNRSGVPLIEVVTEPDFVSAEEAKDFLKQLQLIIRYLDISDADMEKGSMRIEPSISLREINLKSQISNLKNKEEELPNYRVEVKNINSFRFAQKAIDYEIGRQRQILTEGGKIEQETRGWNEATGQTVRQRLKEEAHDYRYFPEPDIPPLQFDDEFIESLRRRLPELPPVRARRFVTEWGIKETDANLLVEDQKMADLFEDLCRRAQGTALSGQKLANWLINRKIDWTGKDGDRLFQEILEREEKAFAVGEAEVTAAGERVVAANPTAVAQYRQGKTAALEFLLGQVVRQLQERGQADPQVIRRVLMELLQRV